MLKGQWACTVVWILLLACASAAKRKGLKRLEFIRKEYMRMEVEEEPRTPLCCQVDVTGSGSPRLKNKCFENTAVQSTAGGDLQQGNPQQLLRCINEANHTLSPAGTWAYEVAALSAVAAWWHPRRPTIPVTVVTQLSIGRLPQLWAQCRSWHGPLSAAIFVPMMEGASRTTKSQLWCAMQQAYTVYRLAFNNSKVCDLDIVLLYEQRPERRSMWYYPVNVLRNVARLQARTDIVAMVDVDMLVSSTLLRWMLQPVNLEALLRACAAKAVFVLPAFEVVTNSTAVGMRLAERFASSSKAQLWASTRNGTLAPFAALRYPRGHNATDYPRWASSAQMYDVQYSEGFEPWVMTHRVHAPWHDARLRGYGYNKISHIAQVNASGFRFVVHPSAFIVHRTHASSVARRRFMMDKAEHFYLLWKNRTDPTFNMRWYNRTVSDKRNMYLRVKGLFSKMKEQMDGGLFESVVDPVTLHCRRTLRWWL